MNDHMSVESLVKIAINVWGGGDYEILKQDSLHEANLLKLDITQAMKELKWTPRFDSTQAIMKTMEWYKSAEPRVETFTTIKKYISS